MGNKQAKLHRQRYSAFTIQLLECALVVVFFSLSFVFAGKLIYNNVFPFGWIDGFLMYIMMSAVAIIALGANKYFSFISRPFPESATKIIGLVIIMNFIFIALLYFSRSIRLSPYYFVVADTFQILSLILIKRFSGLFKAGILRNRISLVIGMEPGKNELIKELQKQSTGKLAFVSFNDEKLEDYINQAANIYLTGLLSKKIKDRIISYCVMKDKKVFIVPETYEIAMRKSEMMQVGDIPLFAIESFRLTEAQNIIKRSIDILLSIVAIILASPIMLFAAIRIKLEDRGPVFFRQVRSGLNGKEFKVIKFRSMVVDAEKYTGAVFAFENDPRVTRVGRFMRTTRIDEIPQFFNVLAGSMSVIGPRPERPQFVQTFSEVLPEYSSRLAVKPGITGLAQVMGNYTTSAENKVKFDLVYIRDYSLLLDLKILFKTIRVVFTKSQSEGFSPHDNAPVFTLEAESTFENQPLLNGSKKTNQDHRVGKAVLVLSCSLIIIFGCMVLRYSALTTAMLEAAALPVSARTTEQPVSTDITAQTGNVSEQESLVAGVSLDGTPASPPVPAADPDASPKTEESRGTIRETNDPSLTEPSSLAAETPTGQTFLASPVKAETVQQKAESTEEVVLSQEEINMAIGKMSISKKMGIAFDLISRLSAADLMILDKLAEGGFTAEEKSTAKEIMYRYFNDTEVEYIKEIYWEYVE